MRLLCCWDGRIQELLEIQAEQTRWEKVPELVPEWETTLHSPQQPQAGRRSSRALLEHKQTYRFLSYFLWTRFREGHEELIVAGPDSL